MSVDKGKNIHFSIHQVDVGVIDDTVQDVKPNQEWVEFGAKDQYYPELLNLFDKANTHRSITLGLADRYAGQGLVYPDLINDIEKAQINRFFPKNCIDKIALDTAIFYRYALLITTNNAGTKISRVKHVPVSSLRPAPCNEEGDITSYFYAKNWQHVRKRKEQPTEYATFDPNKSQQVGEFIYVVQGYAADGNPYLNKPIYSGCLNWIKCEVEISQYHLTNIAHGFSGGLVISFDDDPGVERRSEIEQAIRSRLTGSMGDKVVFVYGAGEQKPSFETIDLPRADKQYEALDKMIESKIIIGHRITSPMLVGVKSNTGLGNNAEEIKTANELLEKTSVSRVHDFILSGLHQLLAWNGYSRQILNEIYIAPVELIDEVREEDTTQLSAEDKIKILTDDDQDYILDYLEDKGESEADLLNNGFELVDTEDCEGDDKLKIKGEQLQKIELQTAWGLTPNNLSKYDIQAPDKSGVWLVRYQYALAQRETPPAVIPTTRKFCRHMVNAAQNGNRVYKREVLENLNNPEFGSYNIFWYKGSYNCRHVWQRKLYFKPNEKGEKVRPVGNVPYVISRTSDKRATTPNRKPTR